MNLITEMIFQLDQMGYPKNDMKEDGSIYVGINTYEEVLAAKSK